MSLKDISLGRAEIYKLDPRNIQVEPGYNPSDRVFDSINDEDDRQLKESIRVHGITETMTVKEIDGVVYIRRGHRRLAAVKELISEGHNIVSVPCAAMARHASDAVETFDIFTSDLRKHITMLGKAELFQRMIDVYGWTDEMLAEHAGITTKQVGNILTLAGASPEVKEMVATDVVSATEAIANIKTEGSKAATEILQEAQASLPAGKTRVTAATVKAVKEKKTPAPTPPPAKVDPSNPFSVMTGGLRASLGVEAPEPEAEVKTPRVLNTPAKFTAMLEVLREVLNVDDVKIIHTMVKDLLAS